MSLSAALLRIFQRSISPDVLTIKGQQNADCKEKAMSRRKGVLVFQIPLTERARTSRRERDGEGRRGWKESKERGSAGRYFCLPSLLFLRGEVVYVSVLPWAFTGWKPLPCPTLSPSSSFSLSVSRVSCWAFVPGALWGIIQCGRSFTRLSGKWGQSRGSQSFIHIS